MKACSRWELDGHASISRRGGPMPGLTKAYNAAIGRWAQPAVSCCVHHHGRSTPATSGLHPRGGNGARPSLWGMAPARTLLHSRQRGSRSVTAQAGGGAIQGLGFDLLTFLTSTVVMVPLFKKFQVSPVLGFLLTGILFHQFGLIRDPKDMEALSELGVLFLLFEMGLELSLDRLKALAKYAFGLGTLQMLLCTGIFTAFALPAGTGLGTQLLEWLAHAPHSLVSIRSVDEAVVIAGALSMSSSAFVLQLLSERGEMPTKFGSATLGILLLQDIAVVPFLVLLPVVVSLQTASGMASQVLVDLGPGTAVAAAAATAVVGPESAGAALTAAAAANPASLVALLGPTALKTCAGLAGLLYGGRILLRRVFEVVAQSDNSETFVGLCLLTVAGAALLTEQLGFSDTMGAFTAGVLLSESSYKTQVEADIRPFRGLLLGLFFVSTGSSIDMQVLVHNWPVICWILLGLITVKTAVISALGPGFGLSRSESIRTGFMLSQGGEFAFVLLSLASSLHILPENLNQVLIIVVVLSMALTPGLAQLGKVAGEWIDENLENNNRAVPAGGASDSAAALHHGVEEPVVICGFGPHGQMLATLLDQPLASLADPIQRAYLAFDLDPVRVQAARDAGFNVVYGDGSRAAVLRAAGVVRPRAIAVCMTSNKEAAHRTVASLRASFPTVPLYALGSDLKDAAELEQAGADQCIIASTSMGIALGKQILTSLGASQSEASQVGKAIEAAVEQKARLLAEKVAQKGSQALTAEAGFMLLGSAITDLASASQAPGRRVVAASEAALADTLDNTQELLQAQQMASGKGPAGPTAQEVSVPGASSSVTQLAPVAAARAAAIRGAAGKSASGSMGSLDQELPEYLLANQVLTASDSDDSTARRNELLGLLRKMQQQDSTVAQQLLQALPEQATAALPPPQAPDVVDVPVLGATVLGHQPQQPELQTTNISTGEIPQAANSADARGVVLVTNEAPNEEQAPTASQQKGKQKSRKKDVSNTPSIATARLDCPSDEECMTEDVAGIVYVDSNKQQQEQGSPLKAYYGGSSKGKDGAGKAEGEQQDSSSSSSSSGSSSSPEQDTAAKKDAKREGAEQAEPVLAGARQRGDKS